MQEILDGDMLVQSRSMLWDRAGRLVVANRDILFYELVATAGRQRSQVLTLVGNVSTPMTGPSFDYSLPVHSLHTRRDRVASLTTCCLRGAAIQKSLTTRARPSPDLAVWLK